MESSNGNNANFLSQKNEHNLYKYSDIDLVAYIKEQNAENYKRTDPQSKKNNQFLEEIALLLQNKLNHNISLHQKGFQIYKQKLLADKSFIQNSLKKELRGLTINELIEKLTNIKNNSSPQKPNEYFNIGQNLNNTGNKNNNNQNTNPALNNILFESNINSNGDSNPFSINNFVGIGNNINNENNINNNYENKKENKNSRIKLIHGLNVKEVYHSPSPLIVHKVPSNIIKENENVNNVINFDEDQKI